MIIGSGSAFYELYENLVKKTPIIFIPKWAKNKIQPVSLRSLIHVLVGSLETEDTIGRDYDICGDEVLTYEEMFRVFSRLFNKRKILIKTWFTNPKFFSYFASLLTPLPESVVRSMLVRARFEMISNNSANNRISFYTPLKIEESILRAMTREQQDTVYTRWSDEYPRAHELAPKLSELKKNPRFISSFSRLTSRTEQGLFQSFCRIGGKEGWLHNNWMWKLRGVMDRVFLGVGISRGRRSISTLRINDVIDFWRVEEIQDNRKLLLRAEMKLPGQAWLEFKIDQEGMKNKLRVTAYYETHGFWGKLYWYFFLPFHYIIFTNLLKQIDLKANGSPS